MGLVFSSFFKNKKKLGYSLNLRSDLKGVIAAGKRRKTSPKAKAKELMVVEACEDCNPIDLRSRGVCSLSD